MAATLSPTLRTHVFDLKRGAEKLVCVKSTTRQRSLRANVLSLSVRSALDKILIICICLLLPEFSLIFLALSISLTGEQGIEDAKD